METQSIKLAKFKRTGSMWVLVIASLTSTLSVPYSRHAVDQMPLKSPGLLPMGWSGVQGGGVMSRLLWLAIKAFLLWDCRNLVPQSSAGLLSLGESHSHQT